MSWQEEAACAGMGPDLFFPKSGNGLSDKAKAICANCEVRVDCLVLALETGEGFGVWGGLTWRERKKLRGQIRRGLNPTLPDIVLPPIQPEPIRNRDRIKPPARCGTEGGHKRHRVNGTPPCEMCRAAHAEGERRRKAIRKERKREAAA